MIGADISRAHVLVIGDVMLDRYVLGHASRLSPEAPVPVLRWNEDRNVPGGAANVAANIASLGGEVSVIGVVGRDQGRAELCEALSGFGDKIGIRFVVDERRPTTLKTRFVCGGQQLLRLDREDSIPLGPEVEQRLVQMMRAQIASADVVVLSDYAKGVLTDSVIEFTIDECRRAGRPVIVDPKRSDFSIYRGASVITPNRQELTRATGLPCETDREAEEAANIVVRTTGAAVLLTRSEKGMSLFGDHE
jgi:D-beta-D-heptose 7-phosphate kinase/D-beta-D-heptose 1-phosphate adenosyltransferase